MRGNLLRSGILRGCLSPVRGLPTEVSCPVGLFPFQPFSRASLRAWASRSARETCCWSLLRPSNRRPHPTRRSWGGCGSSPGIICRMRGWRYSTRGNRRSTSILGSSPSSGRRWRHFSGPMRRGTSPTTTSRSAGSDCSAWRRHFPSCTATNLPPTVMRLRCSARNGHSPCRRPFASSSGAATWCPTTSTPRWGPGPTA